VELALVPHGGQAFLCAAGGRVMEPLGSGNGAQANAYKHGDVAENCGG